MTELNKIKEKYALDSVESIALNKAIHENNKKRKNEGRSKLSKSNIRNGQQNFKVSAINDKLKNYGLSVSVGSEGDYFSNRTEAIRINVPGKLMRITEVKALIKGLQEAVALAQRIPSSK